MPALGLALAILVSGSADVRVRPIAGAEGDFTRAHHVRLEGSWFEIGRELARLACERHGVEPREALDPTRVHEQRAWFAAHAPAQRERMRGLADYFGLDPESDDWELDGLAYGTPRAACTVVHYPPEATEDGHGVLSRNFDFSTGTFDGRVPRPGESYACAEPYVLELHPDGGHASVALVAFDLLGVIDGVNSAGLTVALLADDELLAIGKARPEPGVRAGLDVLQVGRFLLDTCKDVEEAQAALRGAELYYSSIPCHYLIADAQGRAFVWENAVDLSEGHVLESPGAPLVTTNCVRHLHAGAVPDDSNPFGLHGRQPFLEERIAGQGKISLAEVRANATSVSPVGAAPAGHAAGRTLWHALYFPEERALEVDFYLGDGGPRGTRRSEPRRFALEP